eukprot:scaffold35083_cov37-Prasinocladus_malaysianus.AAC.3
MVLSRWLFVSGLARLQTVVCLAIRGCLRTRRKDVLTHAARGLETRLCIPSRLSMKSHEYVLILIMINLIFQPLQLKPV